MNPKYFDAEEHEAFLKSDIEQWEKHLHLGAVKVIPPDEAKNIPKHKILPIASRFVRTDKNKENKKESLKASSRLVIPGHLQQGLPQEEGGERTDAPTVAQLGLHLGLSLCASFRWTPSTFDVSSAFLRGDEMDEELYFKPPRDGLPGVPEGALILALKGVFGLRIAPRLWWKKAEKTINDAGFQALSSLPGFFVIRENKRLAGIILLHVDDGFHAGHGRVYEEAMKKIMDAFDVPEDKRQAGCFNFLGRKIELLKDDTIRVSQKTYIDEIKPILVPKARRSTSEATLTPEEKSNLMSLVGQLAWPARESLPHIAYDVRDRKSTRLNSSHSQQSRMPSSA